AAHRRGVLHRDIKPANILLNRYGCPFLADFNIAFDGRCDHGRAGGMFGGTLAYMAPEHLRAFDPADPTLPEAVDHRAALSVLGMGLSELLTGRRPSGGAAHANDPLNLLRELAAERHAATPSARAIQTNMPEALDRTLQRCLHTEPDRRYQSATEL